MKTLIDQTISKLKKLGAPEILIKLANGEEAPYALKSELQTPYEFYEVLYEDPESMPFEGRIIPLWETNGECLTGYIEQESIVIRYYFGQPKDDYKILGVGIIDALKNFLEFLYIIAGCPKKDILNAAKVCNIDLCI